MECKKITGVRAESTAGAANNVLERETCPEK